MVLVRVVVAAGVSYCCNIRVNNMTIGCGSVRGAVLAGAGCGMTRVVCVRVNEGGCKRDVRASVLVFVFVLR